MSEIDENNPLDDFVRKTLHKGSNELQMKLDAIREANDMGMRENALAAAVNATCPLENDASLDQVSEFAVNVMHLANAFLSWLKSKDEISRFVSEGSQKMTNHVVVCANCQGEIQKDHPLKKWTHVDMNSTCTRPEEIHTDAKYFSIADLVIEGKQELVDEDFQKDFTRLTGEEFHAVVEDNCHLCKNCGETIYFAEDDGWAHHAPEGELCSQPEPDGLEK